MIRTHQSNTAWWGHPVAIITDAAWFDQTDTIRKQSLEPYAWAEFKAPLVTAPPAAHLCQAGFALVDVQMNFRMSLGNVAITPSLEAYECASAAEKPFVICPDEARTFEHERFFQIPGMTPEKLNQRYVSWANDLIAKHPEWCLRLTHHGKTQGWFLSEPNGTSLHLTLAMMAANASVSGQHLYHRALCEYRRLGATMGHAAFSVRNTAVLNIYAQLGARFTPPTGCWLWSQAAS